jgi:ectoine hydroxylase-related dioxygenase (phytanoyl-CoA dioxygenase family)
MQGMARTGAGANMREVDVREFEEKGYVLVREVIDKDTVARLRPMLLEALRKRNSNVLDDGIVYYPELYAVLKSPKLVAALGALLGTPFVVPPHTSVMHNSFGVFHADTTVLDLEGWSFHKDKNYRMVTCAVYLQDNNEFGGGIRLIPGTHRKDDAYVALTRRKQEMRKKVEGSRVRRFLKRASRGRLFDWNKELEEHPDQVDVPSKAGDAVIWDMRLAHRASPAKVNGSQLGGGKVGIFFTAGANNDITKRTYMDFVTSLPANAHLTKTRTTPGIAIPPSTESFIVL